MAREYLRFKLDIALPMSNDPEGKKSKKQRVLEANPQLAEKTVWNITEYDLIFKMLRKLRRFAKTINEKQGNEEPYIAKYHICRHELGLPCTEEEEIMPEKEG